MTPRTLDGAATPGPVPPKSDKADGANVGQVEGQRDVDGGDSAASLIATATVRAAAAGITVLPLAGGAWLLRCAGGGDIGTVRGAGALTAAVAGFEAAQRDVRELLQRMRGAQ